jgi:hypothetical protein
MNPTPSGDVQPGYVRLWCDEPFLDATVRLAEDLPHLTTDEGPWDIVPRAQQVSMTIPKGMGPWRYSLPILLEHPEGSMRRVIYAGQEDLITAINRVWRGYQAKPPGILLIEGIPGIIDETEWVIDTIEEGDYIRRNWDMHRIRQQLTLNLIEFIPPDYAPMAKRATDKGRGKVVTVKVKKGDTPASIARRRGVSWTVLRTLNPGVVTKAAQNLKDGSKIRVPAKQNVSQRKSSRSR